MDQCKAIWNSRYENMQPYGEDPWLSEWLHLVPTGKCRRVLDVGCGAGFNAKFLLHCGFEVHALDFSERALVLCRQVAPKANRILADIRDGLPFPAETFEFVVADLSLHYFSIADTSSVIKDIADKVIPGGLFAGRFNSINDVNYGANEGIPIAGDGNLLIVDGMQKRFFTRHCFSTLIGEQWRLVSLVEKSTHRYGSQKVFWELVCTRRS